MVVERLMEEKRRNLEIFKRLDEIAREIKDMAFHFFGPCRVFIFGSALRGDWHPTLSDIDVAVVTNCEDIEKNFEIQGRDCEKMEHFRASRCG